MIRQYVDHGASALFSPYVAALLVSRGGLVLDIDERSTNFLQRGGAIEIRHGHFGARDPGFNGVLMKAIERVAREDQAETLICPSAAPT